MSSTLTPGWSTQAAAEHYTTFSNDRLITSYNELKALLGQDIDDVEVALPAAEAEMRKRGLL